MKTTLLNMFVILMIVSLGSLAEGHRGVHDGTNEPSDGGARNGGWPGFGSRGKESNTGPVKPVFGAPSGGNMGGFGAIRDAMKGSYGQPGGSMGGKGFTGGMGGMGGMGGFNGQPGGMGPKNGFGGASTSPRKPMGASEGVTGGREN